MLGNTSVVWSSSILFFFLIGLWFSMWTYHKVFIHQSVVKYMGCLQFRVMMHEFAMYKDLVSTNLSVDRCFIFLRYLPRSEIARSCVRYRFHFSKQYSSFPTTKIASLQSVPFSISIRNVLTVAVALDPWQYSIRLVFLIIAILMHV